MLKKRKTPSGGSRRTFLRTLAVAPVVPAIEGSAQNATPQAAEADALVELVRARFGSYLTEADIPEVKRGVERMLRNAEALSKVKLTNADEPDFLFHPFDAV